MTRERIDDLTSPASADWLSVRIERVKVKSGNLDSYGYDAATMTLEVAFLNGGVYRYRQVPIAEFEALEAAASKGSFLYHHVRDAYETVCLVRGGSATKA